MVCEYEMRSQGVLRAEGTVGMHVLLMKGVLHGSVGDLVLSLSIHSRHDYTDNYNGSTARNTGYGSRAALSLSLPSLSLSLSLSLS